MTLESWLAVYRTKASLAKDDIAMEGCRSYAKCREKGKKVYDKCLQKIAELEAMQEKGVKYDDEIKFS